MKQRIEQNKPLNLNDQLNAIGMGLLPTPTAQDFKHRGPNSRQQGLADVVRRWPTPRANSGTGACHHGEGDMDLQTAVQLWPTLMASDADKNSKNRGKYLPGAVWATPTANDAKNSLTESQYGRGTLTAHVVESLWPTPNEGAEARQERLGQLNPDWVEALMGYPQGWTDIEKDAIPETYFPAAWVDGTWEDGIPRVSTGIKNRTGRLKCLGNAIVPQVAAFILSFPYFDFLRNGYEMPVNKELGA